MLLRFHTTRGNHNKIFANNPAMYSEHHLDHTGRLHIDMVIYLQVNSSTKILVIRQRRSS